MARTTLDIAISITPENKAWIDAVKAETGMSRSEVFRSMIDFFVERNIKPIIIKSIVPNTPNPPTQAPAD